MSSEPTPAGVTHDDLRSIPSLSHLENEDLDVLIGHAEFRPLRDGGSLFEEGHAAEALFFIADGAVRIHQSAPGGGRTELAVLARGAILGELGLLLRRKRTATASALGNVSLLRVPRDALIEDYRCGEKYALALLLGVAVTLAQRLETSNLRVSATEQRMRPRGSDLESFKRKILEEWAL